MTALDKLSGAADPAPLDPFSVDADRWWTAQGSDPTKEREFALFDVAGNQTRLAIKVRCEPDEYDLTVLRPCYYRDKVDVRIPQRNTIVYRHLRGRSLGRSLLAVQQHVSIREGPDQDTIRAAWDIVHDDTELER